MSKRIRPTLVILIMAMAWIAGAYGESVSVGRGSSVAVSEGSSAEGTLISDGTVTQSSVSSTGVIDDLNIDPWVSNIKGDYVEIGVTGTNVAGFSYADDFYPGKDSVWVSDAVWADQWIGASWADSLNAYSYARNAAGDEAKADITIDHGSLGGYHNGAYAGHALWLGVDRGAFVGQSADYAAGSNIQINTWARSAVNDRAGSGTEIKNGVLNGYSAIADAVRYTNGLRAAGVQVDRMSASAPYGSIGQAMCAIDYWGDTSQVTIAIPNGNLYSYPYDVKEPAIAYSISDIWRKTYASQSSDAEIVRLVVPGIVGLKTGYLIDPRVNYGIGQFIFIDTFTGREQTGEIAETG